MSGTLSKPRHRPACVFLNLSRSFLVSAFPPIYLRPSFYAQVVRELSRDSSLHRPTAFVCIIFVSLIVCLCVQCIHMCVLGMYSQVVRDLSRDSSLRTAVLVGGDAMEAQFAELSHNPDVIVATPGGWVCVRMCRELAAFDWAEAWNTCVNPTQ